MPRTRDNVEMGAGDALLEDVGVLHRDDDVVIAMQDQGGRVKGG